MDNERLGHVIRPEPGQTGRGGFHLMNSYDPARRFDTHSLRYRTLEELCDANGLTIGKHYDNRHGEYWRALPNATHDGRRKETL